MGMTLAEFYKRMTASEFDLRVGLDLVKAEECPNCGSTPRDMMKLQKVKQHCPVCNEDYFRIKDMEIGKWRSSEQDTPSGGSQAGT